MRPRRGIRSRLTQVTPGGRAPAVLNPGPGDADIADMRGSRRATLAAKGFVVVVLVGCGALAFSASRPWLTINGVTYTFFNADGWKALPTAELAVAAGGALAALMAVRHVRRIGLAIGLTALVLNVVGAVVAARLANIHNPNQYFRTSAILTMRPNWAGWMALLVCVALILGSASRSVGDDVAWRRRHARRRDRRLRRRQQPAHVLLLGRAVPR